MSLSCLWATRLISATKGKTFSAKRPIPQETSDHRLRHHRQVTTEEAEKKAQEFNVMFIETSAKAGHNVKVLFKKIAQALPGKDKDAEGSTAGAAANKSRSDPLA